MQGSKFVPEVKERGVGLPCFVMLNADQDIGIDKKQIIFDLPDSTGIEEAEDFARALRSFSVGVRIG